MRRRVAWRIGLVVAVFLQTSAARADDAATADALFREARKAMQRGDWAEAEARLTESQRLAPAPGTLLNMAIAEEKLGKLSTAWEHARSARDQLAVGDDRWPIARSLFESLDARVPRVVLRAAALPPGARVQIDDTELGIASLGVPLPIDPGEHRIVVRAPWRADRVVVTRASEGTTREEVLDAGAPLVLPPAAADTAQRSPRGSTMRTIGWLGVGVGGAALATGGVFAALTAVRNATVNAHCQGRTCDQEGFDASRQGRTFSAVSTAAIIGGAVLVLGGVALIVMSAR